MSTFGTGTFGDGRFGDPEYVFVDGQYRRLAWKVRWDEGYEGKIGFAVPELENMRYAAPQMEQGELPTAFALNPDDLLPGRVEGGGGLGHIAAETIVGTDIQAESVHADRLVSNSITATQIEAGSITSNELSVASLDAISGRMGTLAAGIITLDGSTLLPSSGSGSGGDDLSALIQTSDTNPKVTFDEQGIIQYDENNVETLRLGPGESLSLRQSETDAVNSLDVDINSYSNGSLTGQDGWIGENPLVVSGSSPNKLAGASRTTPGSTSVSNRRPVGSYDFRKGWQISYQVRLTRPSVGGLNDRVWATWYMREELEDVTRMLSVELICNYSSEPVWVRARYYRHYPYDVDPSKVEVTLAELAPGESRDYTITIGGYAAHHNVVTVESAVDEEQFDVVHEGDPLSVGQGNNLSYGLLCDVRGGSGLSGTCGAYFKSGITVTTQSDVVEERKLYWLDSIGNKATEIIAYTPSGQGFPVQDNASIAVGNERQAALNLHASDDVVHSVAVHAGERYANILTSEGYSSFQFRDEHPPLLGGMSAHGNNSLLLSNTWNEVWPSSITYYGLFSPGPYSIGSWVIKKSGLYLLDFNVFFSNNAQGWARHASIRVDGSDIARQVAESTAGLGIQGAHSVSSTRYLYEDQVVSFHTHWQSNASFEYSTTERCSIYLIVPEEKISVV